MAELGAIRQISPNTSARRGGVRPDLIVLHHTAMTSAEAALARLCDPAPPEGLSPVSCHYLIAEDGRLWQLVEEADRAWHAGQGAWGNCTDVNSASIGIELSNRPGEPFAEPQMRRLEALLPGIMARWDVPPEGVIAHSDLAPHRKTDPGPKFDWRRLARQGLSVWPDAPARAEGDFWADLETIGYRAPDVAEPQTLLLSAFRMRFRPWARGPLDAADRAAARDLAARCPARGRG